MTNEFTCSECGRSHELPFAYGSPAPVGYLLVPENERDGITIERVKQIAEMINHQREQPFE